MEAPFQARPLHSASPRRFDGGNDLSVILDEETIEMLIGEAWRKLYAGPPLLVLLTAIWIKFDDVRLAVNLRGMERSDSFGPCRRTE
ncbi:hypothetical protein [Rhizobium sp. Nf11,1]|uniref:hypothetical protein n=1 Tax=Rhizobium sp. Nf11,1 TaxID=3404923 RepID=UPI003D339540